MPIIHQARHQLGDIVLLYRSPHDNPSLWSLTLVPVSLENKILTPRENLDTPSVQALPAAFLPMRAWDIPPLVAFHRRGDPLPSAFANGRTFLTSPSPQRPAATTQTMHRDDDSRATIIRTITCHHDTKLTCIHDITHRDDDNALIISSTIRNDGAVPVTLDYASSFTLGGLTPFAADDASERLRIHRCRSVWSAEARHEEHTLEQLHLERSWTGHGVRCERYGQAGSMPANGWLPFAAVEDRDAGVTWAARLASPGSWQMELLRRADQLTIAGSHADRHTGEWHITLAPGEHFTAPVAHITTVAGSLDDACDRLLDLQRPPLAAQPAVERDLPVIFNEWCASWGAPAHDNLLALARTLSKNAPGLVKYLVIDDGWAERSGRGFQQNGDWKLNRSAFPRGLRATADALRALGFTPGIWFEFEAVTPGSQAWNETAHQLHRDGIPLQVGPRRFWDFRDPWVLDYLTERMTALLRDNGIGYLKIDHNDTLGPGVDGPGAPGENLRAHLQAVQDFLARLRGQLPGLVIENCSSGGHRLEPTWLALTALSSITDAHETPDIPIIAAGLHRHILPAQSQIWAVLRASDTRQRLAYSLAATFLGRMCLSGDIQNIAPENWPLIRAALAAYRAAVPLIRDGRWRTRPEIGDSWQHPRGWQISTATDAENKNLLLVWHRFAGEQTPLAHPLPAAGSWRIVREFADAPSLSPGDSTFRLTDIREWSGGAALLAR